MSERVKIWIGDAMGYISVAAVSLVYIATAFLMMGRTDKTLAQIIADGAATFLLGVCINFNLSMQGIVKGNGDGKMQETLRLHGETVERLSSRLDLLDSWCRERNKEALREARRRVLSQVGLRYVDCFDSEGVPILQDFTRDAPAVQKRKKCALRRATRLKLSKVSATVLTSNGEQFEDPYYLGESKSQYERRTSVKDVVSKLLVAVVFGYFGVSFIDGFQWSELIWRCLQVAILLAMGTVKMTRSRLFVVDTYRSSIVKKINYLQMFENWAITQRPEREEEKNGDANKAVSP